MASSQYKVSKRKIVWIIIVLIIGAFLWTASIINHIHISDYHGGVSVRFQEAIVTRQRIDNILEVMISREDPHIPEITLWQIDEHIVVSNKEDNKSIELSLITVAGDMSRIYPVPMLYGGYLPSEDGFGCVIDRSTAYKLFGSSNAVGLRTKLNNKEYIIRGVIEEIDSNVMIIQEEASSSKSINAKRYSCMEMSYTDTENAKLLTERFVTSNGFGMPEVIIDGYLISKLSYMLIHLPLWLSALLIIIYLARKVYSLKASPIVALMGFIGILIISLILIKVTNMHIYYTNSMIPNRWSDFDFWADKIRTILSSISRKEGMVVYYKDMMLRKRMLMVIMGVVAAGIAELYMVHRNGAS